MKEMMKAIVATGYGTPEVFQLQKVPKPEPGESELLIKVYASSATQADSMMRTGTPYFARLFTGLRKPKHAIPGTGFAGVVEAIGENVKNFKPGDSVFGETTLGFGTNAEYFTISEKGVVLPKPENLSYTEASCFCDGHLTSYNFLKEIAQIKPNQKVLINGASGSLGSAAVQIAKYFKAEVTGVCSTRNMGLVKCLGADHVLDYTHTDFTKNAQHYEIIFDTVGKSSYRASKKALSEKGVYLSAVMKISLLFQMMWTSIFGRKKAKFSATGLLKDEELRKQLAELIIMFKEGRLQTIIDRQYPLEKLAEAHAYIDFGHKKGNVVMINNHKNNYNEIK